MQKYLKFTGNQEFTLGFVKNSSTDANFEYSYDNTTWNKWSNASTSTINSSSKIIYLRVDATVSKRNRIDCFCYGSNYFTFTDNDTTVTDDLQIYISGSLKALLDYESDCAGLTITSSWTIFFQSLFENQPIYSVDSEFFEGLILGFTNDSSIDLYSSAGMYTTTGLFFRYMFKNTKITSIPSGFFNLKFAYCAGNSNSGYIIDITDMFSNCNITSIESKAFQISSWFKSDNNTQTNDNYISYIHPSVYNNLIKDVLTNVTSFPEQLFYNCEFNGYYKSSDYKLSITNNNIETLPSNLFDNCTFDNLFGFDFNFENIIEIKSNVFNNCTFKFNQYYITYDSNSCTLFSNLFADCLKLKTVEDNFFNNCKVIYDTNMFNNYMDNIRKIISQNIFKNCENLTYVDKNLVSVLINDFLIYDLSYMFYGCNNISNLSEIINSLKFNNYNGNSSYLRTNYEDTSAETYRNLNNFTSILASDTKSDLYNTEVKIPNLYQTVAPNYIGSRSSFFENLTPEKNTSYFTIKNCLIFDGITSFTVNSTQVDSSVNLYYSIDGSTVKKYDTSTWETVDTSSTNKLYLYGENNTRICKNNALSGSGCFILEGENISLKNYGNISDILLGSNVTPENYAFCELFAYQKNLTNISSSLFTNVDLSGTNVCYRMFYNSGVSDLISSTIKFDTFNTLLLQPKTYSDSAFNEMFSDTIPDNPLLYYIGNNNAKNIYLKLTSDQNFSMVFCYNTLNWNLEYSIDESTWNTVVSADTVTTTNNYIYFRGKDNTGKYYTGTSEDISYNLFTISENVDITVTGYLTSLINYKTYNSKSLENYLFSGIFNNVSQIKDISGLILAEPGSEFKTFSFNKLFNGCTGLTTIPNKFFNEFSFNSSGKSSEYMFLNCTGLTTIPENLFYNCQFNDISYMFFYMFQGCAALTTISESIFNNCSFSGNYLFHYMFQGCTTLTTISESIFNNCSFNGSYLFHYMFQGCTTLTTLPTLTSLFNNCSGYPQWSWHNLFKSCTGLTTIPENFFSENGETMNSVYSFNNYNCFYMFNSCTGLTSLPDYIIPVNEECHTNLSLFINCTGLTSLPKLKSNLNYDYYVQNIFNNLFQNCTNIKLNDTQTLEYSKEWILEIPNISSTFDINLGPKTIKNNTTYYIKNPDYKYLLFEGLDGDKKFKVTYNNCEIAKLYYSIDGLTETLITTIDTINCDNGILYIRGTSDNTTIYNYGLQFSSISSDDNKCNYISIKNTGNLSEALLGGNTPDSNAFNSMFKDQTMICNFDSSLFTNMTEDNTTMYTSMFEGTSIKNINTTSGNNRKDFIFEKDYGAVFGNTVGSITPNTTYYYDDIEAILNYNNKCFKITPLTSDNYSLSFSSTYNNFSYSTDNGTTWTYVEQPDQSYDNLAGKSVWIMADDDINMINNHEYGPQFSFSNVSDDFRVKFSGNLMSLVSGLDAYTTNNIYEGFDLNEETEHGQCKFNYGDSIFGLSNTLISSNSEMYIKDISELYFPENFARSYCMRYLFSNCSNLDILPSTPIIYRTNNIFWGNYNYTYLFQNCTSITGSNIPKFKIIKLGMYECLNNCFDGCGINYSTSKDDTHTIEYTFDISELDSDTGTRYIDNFFGDSSSITVDKTYYLKP